METSWLRQFQPANLPDDITPFRRPLLIGAHCRVVMPSLLARWMDSEHQERDVRILTAKIDTTSKTVDSEGKITDRWPSLKTVWFMRIEAPKTPREHGAVFTLTMGVCTPTHQRISNDPYLATTPYNRAHKTARHYLCARCIHHLQHLRYLVPRCLDYLLNTLWWQVQ